MNKNETKYMETLGTLGLFIGFIILIYYSITQKLHILILIALLFIFGFRLLGYLLDKKATTKKD